MLDIFTDDAFGVIELTLSINKLPYKPGRLGRSGWFKNKSTSLLTATIEEKHGTLALIPTAARGSMPTYDTRAKRHVRAFAIPHLPFNDAVMADEVQGVRAFGEEDVVETVAEVVNEKLESLRQSHELTHEHHRIGAIQGVVLDADGTSVIYDWFDEFNLAQLVLDIDPANDEMKAAAMMVEREMETRLGATPSTGIRAFCGNQFWDDFIANESVKDAFALFKDNEFARVQQNREGFEFAGITWENYRGKLGDVDFINDDACTFFPEGVPNMFVHISAPANFTETVNTLGKVVYSKQERMRFDIGIELHTQSNPLIMPTRPGFLLKAIPGGSSSSA